MNPKIPMMTGLISVILAFLCIFLPWMRAVNMYMPMWAVTFALLYTPNGFLFVTTGALVILGENLGLIGSVTITKQRGRFPPLTLLVGAILSILSGPAFIITESMIGASVSYLLGLLSFGFWLELVAGSLMLIAGILGFVSLRKKVEATIPPTQIT